MCIITTSYPCPEGDLADLLQRINNTRKLVPCDMVSSRDGGPSSCAGTMVVQHHLLGDSQFCLSCSRAAAAAYAEIRTGYEKKRKAGVVVADEAGKKGKAERMGKRAKTGEMSVASEVGPDGCPSEAVDTASDTLLKTVSAVDKVVLVDITKEVVDPQEIQEPPVVGGHLIPELPVAGNEEPGAAEPTEVVAGTQRKTREVTEVSKMQTEDAPTTQGPSVDLLKAAEDHMPGFEEGAEIVCKAEEDQRNLTPTPASIKKATKTSKPKIEGWVARPAPRTSHAQGGEHSELSDLEQVQSLILKMHQKQIQALKNRDDVLKRNATLVAQITYHQDEMANLRTRLSQQNAQHHTEMEKQKGAGKDVCTEKAVMRREKEDLEAKVGRLMQTNDELVKATSTATEETTAVRARVRGLPNQVAELERQTATMEQVVDGRKKQIEEVSGQGHSLERQISKYVRTKTAGLEAEVTRLKQGMAAVEEENIQLRAAVVQRVLLTPISQEPEPSPAPTQGPADDSVVKSQKDVKVEE